MNIFPIEEGEYRPCPIKSAQSQCDKHVVKMIVESGQMLSTVHRMLDGDVEMRRSKSGKRIVKYWKLKGYREDLLYKAVHMNHPCTVWSRESSSNYRWHYEHFIALCKEYTYRYGKVHRTEKLLGLELGLLPKNIPVADYTPFKLAMSSNPECMFPDDPVKSYRMFYQTKQDRFSMIWTGRSVPEWFQISG
tara:strand:- start:3782 stop:4354 length:573 start_codon:yes stop_codon:yes gene_type:complete